PSPEKLEIIRALATPRCAAAPPARSPARAARARAAPASPCTRASRAHTTPGWPAGARARRAGATNTDPAPGRAASGRSAFPQRSLKDSFDSAFAFAQHGGHRTGQVQHGGRLIQGHAAVEDEIEAVPDVLLDVVRVDERP